ncbi:hypothetical protein L6R52_15455 [Myxococcota bacterium]|nr:hypothetical protein [Myxococcota bacterium]
MPSWAESYEELSEEQQARVQRWLHLNKFIAHALNLTWKDWVDKYLAPAMEKPMDYAFLEAVLTDFQGLGLEGQGVTFSKSVDPSTRAISRVPLRAKNNLGRLSPELQDAIAGMLEKGAPERAKLTPADAAMLQKIFPGEKKLAKLPKPAFRKLSLARDEDDVVLEVEDEADPVLRQTVVEFGAVMSRTLV